MADVLDFNSNRNLGFDHDRDLEFQPGRKLMFDPDRKVGFDPGRDLGFGKKGVVFRGFVCPICGASVTEEQPTCTECGAVFERKGSPPPGKEPRRPTASLPPREAPRQPARPPPPLPGQTYPMPPKRPDVRHCVYCGARVSGEDAFCWNCGNRAAGPRR